MSSTPTGNSQRLLLLILLLVCITRLPFIWNGYGPDGDSWRVADTAKRLWTQGEYTPSRLPGYPLHEFISAPFVGLGGSPLSNASTVAAMLLLVVLWSRFISGTARFPVLSLLALACAPLMWQGSVTTMDYVWSMVGVVSALLYAQKGKALPAGILLGVAAGFRPVNIVAIVPVALMLFGITRSIRTVALMAAGAGLASVVAFLPLLARYGFVGWIEETFFQVRDIRIGFAERVLLAGYRGIYAFGPLAVLSAGVIILRKWSTLRTMVQRVDSIPLVACSGLVTFGLLFLAYPLEREYLLPALPFLILLIDVLATRSQFIGFLLCLVSFALINPDVIRHQGWRGVPEFNVHAGMVCEYPEKLNSVHVHRKALAGVDLAGRNVVLTGGGPIRWFENDALEEDTTTVLPSTTERIYRQKANPETIFIDVLPLNEVKRLQQDGYTVCCLESVAGYLESLLGYSMLDNGVILLPMDHLE